MTNDITTLNGSLQELGETMADNLTTMGVTASASDGLTTLAGKILDIPVTPVTKLLTVTSTKDILSYADSDTCTFTATYTENGSPVSGKTVTFKAYQNGTLVENIGSDTTDASGEASVSYSSKGAGDLNISVECNLLQETYVIEDCIKYVSSVSSDTTYEISLPSTWKFTWKYTRTANSQTGWVNVGTSNNRVLGGLFGSTGLNGIWIYKNGSYTTQQNANTFPTNSEQSCTFSCDGTNYTYERNGTSVTVSYDSTITDSFLSVSARRAMSDLKVKPL